MTRHLPTVLLMGGIFALAACDAAPTEPLAAPDGAQESSALAPGAASIVDIVVASSEADEAEFTLLRAAIEYIAATNEGSALLARLADRSQVTVFAPTDQAFLDLVNAVAPLVDGDILANEGPFAAIDALLGVGTIEAVVSYHVTAGRRIARSVVPAARSPRPRTIETLLDGASFQVTNAGQILAVGNTANIVDADVSASNGIVHVIDAVILPVDLGL